MGAQDFDCYVKGKTAEGAFRDAVDQALYYYGHRGYTGSIAEKHDYVVVGKVKTYAEAEAMARKLMDDNDDRITDKWGPAGCIEVLDDEGERGFLFFGWASS